MEDIRRNLTILALNNLIDDYSYALENIEGLPKEVKDFLQACIEESYNYLYELKPNPGDEIIKRPVWG